MKEFIKKIFPGFNDYVIHKKVRQIDNEKVFSSIYNKNVWESSESVSGPGSELIATNHIINELQPFFKKFNIESILDAPCGDFNWFKHIDLKNINYTGIDVVPDLIDKNTKTYQKSNIKFLQGDLSKISLPKVDLIFCRDCLVHLSYETTYEIIKNFKNSGSKYLMTTSFSEVTENVNIVNGEWRKINLTKPPFKFPDAEYVLNESGSEVVDDKGRSHDKTLSLWKLQNLDV